MKCETCKYYVPNRLYGLKTSECYCSYFILKWKIPNWVAGMHVLRPEEYANKLCQVYSEKKEKVKK